MAAGNLVHVGNGHASIVVDRLTRWFGKTCAVDDFSLEIGSGQVVGFIGPNGAGKTTTMRILATLDEPDRGDAFIDGFSVVDDPDQVRKRMGYMPDNYGTYPNVNCLEYLDFFARAYGLMGSARLAAIGRVLEFTHLYPLAEKPITGLSKGMKQRLCLGRALIHDPPVLILDEPAAGLDPRARIELKEMIKQLAADGKSLLISSHILSELAEICDQVAIIEHGKLLAQGTVQEILRASAPATVGPDTEKTQLRVDVLGDAAAVVAWLRDRPGVEQVTAQGSVVECWCSTAPDFHADLLAAMVQAGFRVTRFTERQRSLEDAFLHVTQGTPR